jgi:signal transduction histidine kinase
MDLPNVLVFFGILLNLYFALLIHFESSHSRAERIFEFTVYAICGWCFSMLFYRSVYVNVELWARLLYFFPTFIPSGFLLFGLHFPNDKVPKKFIYLILTLSITMASLTLLPNAVIDRVVIPAIGERIIFFGWAYYFIYIIYIPTFFLASYFVLFRKFLKSDTIVKAQVRTILVSLLVASTVGMVSNLVLPTFGYFEANWMGQFFTFVWVGGATYAILKHGFLNVRVFATQLFVVVILLILLARIFTFTSLTNLTLDSVVFVIVLVFSILLIKSVMSEIKQREKLQELTERLREIDKQKDEFLSMAAHELRAPMTAIKGYVSMVLEGDTGEIPEKARGFLAETGSITDRLVRLVNNMLDVSRIEEGRILYQVEEENLSVPIRSVFSQFTPEAERKGLKYTLKIPKNIKDKVFVDPDRIQEVIGNLISNAVKYTDEGFVEVKMTQPKPEFVRVEIVDSGIGIAKDEQNKLFQKFHRVESNVGKTTGTGLGLYISKLIVEKFKGNIGVISDEGKGSTFWFDIPLAEHLTAD